MCTLETKLELPPICHSRTATGIRKISSFRSMRRRWVEESLLQLRSTSLNHRLWWKRLARTRWNWNTELKNQREDIFDFQSWANAANAISIFLQLKTDRFRFGIDLFCIYFDLFCIYFVFLYMFSFRDSRTSWIPTSFNLMLFVRSSSILFCFETSSTSYIIPIDWTSIAAVLHTKYTSDSGTMALNWYMSERLFACCWISPMIIPQRVLVENLHTCASFHLASLDWKGHPYLRTGRVSCKHPLWGLLNLQYNCISNTLLQIYQSLLADSDRQQCEHQQLAKKALLTSRSRIQMLSQRWVPWYQVLIPSFRSSNSWWHLSSSVDSQFLPGVKVPLVFHQPCNGPVPPPPSLPNIRKVMTGTTPYNVRVRAKPRSAKSAKFCSTWRKILQTKLKAWIMLRSFPMRSPACGFLGLHRLHQSLHIVVKTERSKDCWTKMTVCTTSLKLEAW